ncbi:cache domain-containing protein [Pseudomonas sp. IC_126]|uniref:cache domain-containing protein n=1 Tax=Pseudomonas sp. IC_126 TaxID=2547400 RepID=UPI0021149AD4|nr:cache domain-containing protein [Pseudomonas sp. IC_126]
MSLSLRKKIVLSTCAAVLLAGTSQLSLNFIESRKSLESHIAEQVAIASKTFSASVRYWLQSKEAALLSVPVDETSGLQGALVQAKVAGGFENVFFARADGSQINADQVSLPADNNDPRRWKWYQQALLTPSEVYISTPSVAAATGQFVLSLGRTLQHNGQALGVVGADVGMGEILDQLKQIELRATAWRSSSTSRAPCLATRTAPTWTRRSRPSIRRWIRRRSPAWLPTVARGICSTATASACTPRRSAMPIRCWSWCWTTPC